MLLIIVIIAKKSHNLISNQSSFGNFSMDVFDVLFSTDLPEFEALFSSVWSLHFRCFVDPVRWKPVEIFGRLFLTLCLPFRSTISTYVFGGLVPNIFRWIISMDDFGGMFSVLLKSRFRVLEMSNTTILIYFLELVYQRSSH